MIDDLKDYYIAYIKRNKTYEEFESDVNTLGGSFYYENGKKHGWIETKKGLATVMDKKDNIVGEYKLKAVYDLVKGNTLL